MSYVSDRVFNGIRTISKKKRQIIMGRLMTDKQIIQGLMQHAQEAGDASYVVKAAANRIGASSKNSGESMTSEAEGTVTEGVLGDIFAECARRRDQDGITSECDDDLKDGMLAVAAAYSALSSHPGWTENPAQGRRKLLLESAALLVAEIERLDRLEKTESGA